MLTAPVATVFKFGYTTSSYGPDFDPRHRGYELAARKQGKTVSGKRTVKGPRGCSTVAEAVATSAEQNMSWLLYRDRDLLNPSRSDSSAFRLLRTLTPSASSIPTMSCGNPSAEPDALMQRE